MTVRRLSAARENDRPWVVEDVPIHSLSAARDFPPSWTVFSARLGPASIRREIEYRHVSKERSDALDTIFFEYRPSISAPIDFDMLSASEGLVRPQVRRLVRLCHFSAARENVRSRTSENASIHSLSAARDFPPSWTVFSTRPGPAFFGGRLEGEHHLKEAVNRP
jgi:hypothetical protein